MPSLPMKPCSRPRCPKLSRGGPCPEHKRADSQRYESQPRRRQDKRFYASAEWRRLRAYVLTRDPLCRICGQVPSWHVDHIIPRSAGGPDTVENLRGLCRRCHASVTAQAMMRDEGGRWG